MDLDKVISKVQKLLALSKSDNAGEAAAAMNAANKLIDQYRLSLADLETSEDTLDPMMEDSEAVYETGRIVQWKSFLVGVLSKHYGCALFNQTTFPKGRKVSHYKLVGRKSDIAIVRYFVSYLMNECQRLCEKEAHGKGKVFANSYCTGFVAGIQSQLAASRKEAEKEATGSAIVAINRRVEEANNFMNTLYRLKSSNSSSQARTDYSAYSRGLQQGKNLHLGAGLNSGGSTSGIRLLGN
jgi:hypothetical protein